MRPQNAVEAPCPRCAGRGDAHFLTCPTLRRPCLPGYKHVFMRESDGVLVCQVCGDVKQR